MRDFTLLRVSLLREFTVLEPEVFLVGNTLKKAKMVKSIKPEDCDDTLKDLVISTREYKLALTTHIACYTLNWGHYTKHLSLEIQNRHYFV